MTGKRMTGKPNSVAREISEALSRKVEEKFAEFGSYERLTEHRTASILYRNLFNMLLGAYCSDYGMEGTINLLGDILKKEQEMSEGRKILSIEDGWRSPR